MALASVAGVAIWLGSSGQDSLESLSLNLGADLIGTILAVFLIGPIIERAELRRDSVLERFDHSKFIRQVAAARHRVFILELWTDLLQGGYTRHFLDALREALQQRVEVRMLLLSPYARAAEQRADDLRRQTNVVENIMDNLRTLHQLRRDLPERQRDNMEVRVYKALPPVQMYRVDDHVVVSFYPVNVTSWNAAQYQTNPQAQLGAFVGAKFDELWEDARTVTLDQYHLVTIEIADGANHLRYKLYYVSHDGETYLDGHELVADYLDQGIRGLPVRLVGGNAKGELEVSGPYSLARIEARSDEFARAKELFTRKYGQDYVVKDGQDHKVMILKLVKAPES